MRLVSPIGSAFLLIAALDLAAAQPAPSLAPASPVAQPTADGLRIDWEVKNRFRLFRNEHDFQRQVAASRSDGVLGAEQRLARDTAGRGWARNVVTNLCVDGAGNVTEVCVRDGVREIYLAPADHRVGVIAANAPAGAACAWSFDDGDQPARQQSVPCEEEVTLRVRYGRPTIAVVEIARADGTADHASTEILVRDVLIAGLGDSVASGDGNPDRAVVLADEGFCFRRFLGGGRSEYFRPSRAGYRGPKACGGVPEPGRPDSDWARYGARWMSAPCHRSLYGYQMRTALALAVENSRIAVTFVPLGCTGATIEDGLLSGQRARETAVRHDERVVALHRCAVFDNRFVEPASAIECVRQRVVCRRV